MQDRLMVFVDGSNLLRATSTKIQAKIRSDKPSEDAISLCSMIVTLGTLLTKLNNSIVNSEGFKFFFDKTFFQAKPGRL